MTALAELLRGARARADLETALALADLAIDMLERTRTPGNAAVIARLRRQYHAIHGATRQENQQP